MAKDEQLRLSSFLKTLRDELRDATTAAAREEGGPILDIAERELERGLTSEAQGNASANFYVFRLGGGGQRTQTQTIRLKLTPSEISPPPQEQAPAVPPGDALAAALEPAGFARPQRRSTGVVKTHKGAKA